MKKWIGTVLTASLMALCLTGCSNNTSETTAATTAQTTEASSAAPTQTTAESKEETAAETSSQSSDSAGADAIRIGSLKGPTSMGLTGMMDNPSYSFQMVTAADELVAAVASKKVDIALVPANVASVLYNKTSNVSVIDINTLGVLYIVSSDESLKTIPDLKGKTIYLTGKGTSPDYVLQYLLNANGLSSDDVTLEYKSEAAEVAAILKEQPDAVGLLPQPFATVACTQNEAVKPVMDLTEQWDAIQGENGSRLVTGVTIVRNDFLADHSEEITAFLDDHKASSVYVNENPEKAAEKIAELGIVAKAPIAQKALPYCNITYIDGQDMKDALSGYLRVLFDQDPSSVGGKLPEDDFYYLP